MSLDAFTASQLQTALAIYRSADGQDIEQAINAEIDRRVTIAQPLPRPATRIACPTPGCGGILTPWPIISKQVGAPVIGCRQCQYSRMEVDRC